MACTGIAPTTLVLPVPCSKQLQLQKNNKFNYKYQCALSMNCTSPLGHHNVPAVCCSAWGFWRPDCPVWWKYFWWRYIGASSAISQAGSKVRSGYTSLKCMKQIWHAEFQAVLKWTKVKMSYIALEVKIMKTKNILQIITVLLSVFQMPQNKESLLSWRDPKHNPHASHSCERNTLFGEVAACLLLEEPCSADFSSIFQGKGQISPVFAS